MTRNIGEGVAIFGIMVAVGLTKNYWLLFFMIMPIWTWLSLDDKVKDKNAEYYYKEKDLEFKKLQEEIRILEMKKK